MRGIAHGKKCRTIGVAPGVLKNTLLYTDDTKAPKRHSLENSREDLSFTSLQPQISGLSLGHGHTAKALHTVLQVGVISVHLR